MLNNNVKRQVLFIACFLLINYLNAYAYTESNLINFYDYDASQPLSPVENEVGEQYLVYTEYEVWFNSVHGERVNARLIMPWDFRLPWQPPTRFPCIVYLHPAGGSNEMEGWFLDLVYVIMLLNWDDRYAIFAIDSEYCGQRAQPGRDLFSGNLVQDRNGMATTIIDNRRAIDYLQTRRDIDPNRIYVFGISMGGILGGVLGAVDQRVRAMSLVVAGGNWSELIQLTDMPQGEPLREAMNNHYEQVDKWWAPIDPINTIHLFSPRALQMHNAKYDTTVPTWQELYDAAGEPKSLYVYDADHYTIAFYTWDILDRTIEWFNEY